MRNWQLAFVLLVLSACRPATSLAQFAAAQPAIVPPPPGAAFPWSFPAPGHARQPAATPHPAVVRIVAPEKGAVSYGSGTLVDVRGDYGLVVTNWHVVRDATENITVVFPDGFRCAARVLKTDQDWDLAALAVWRPNVQPVSISAANPRRGDVLTIAGYGSGAYRAATGRCTGFGSPNQNLPMDLVDLSAEARQGDSGGPIFNAQGELAGVLFGATHGSTVGSFSSRVRWFLEPLAPDLGRPDTSSIAARNAGRAESANVTATTPRTPPLPSAQYPAPAIAQQPPRPRPTPEQPAAAPPQIAKVERPPATQAGRLAPVSPPEIDRPRHPNQPIPISDHLAVADFATPTVQPLADPAPSKEAPVNLEAKIESSRSATGTVWQSWAGDTLAQQIKTVLAAVGVLAVLFHGLRLLVKSSPPPAPAMTEAA